MWWRNISLRHGHGQLFRMSSSYNKNCTNKCTWWSVCSSVASYSDDAPTKKGKVAPLQVAILLTLTRLPFNSSLPRIVSDIMEEKQLPFVLIVFFVVVAFVGKKNDR
jgi:hypothetical protein